MKGTSSCVNMILGLVLVMIIIANGIVVLYACLLWQKYEKINAQFLVGIIIFVVCTTLPFALITGFLVRIQSINLEESAWAPFKNFRDIVHHTGCGNSIRPLYYIQYVEGRPILLPRLVHEYGGGTFSEMNSSEQQAHTIIYDWYIMRGLRVHFRVKVNFR